MKIKHVLATLALSGVMAVGVGAAIGLNAGQKVESVGAATTKLYLDCSFLSDYGSVDSPYFKIHTWDGTTDHEYDVVRADVNSNLYWYGEVDISALTASGSGYRFRRYKSNGTKDKDGTWQTAPSNNYYCKVNGWDDLTWSAPDTTTWKVSGTKNIALSSVKFDGSGLQAYSQTVVLEKDDVIQFTSESGDTLGYSALSTYNNQSANEKGLFVDNGDGKVKVTAGGTYEIYVNVVNKTVWTQVGSDAEAAAWAEGFVEGLNCDSGYKTAPNNWSTYSTSYGQLTEGARHILGDATANKNGTDIEKAAFMHDLCVSKYPTSCPAFMQKTGGALRTAVITKNVIANSVENNVSLVVIIAVASLSVLAAGGYFFYRKRKEN